MNENEIKAPKVNEGNEIEKSGNEAVEKVKAFFDGYQVAEAANAIVEFSNAVNKYVADNAPWTLAKEEKMTECGIVLYNVLEAMRKIGIMLYPYCPNIAKKIFEQLSLDFNVKYNDIDKNKLQVGKITEKEKISPVFPRMDSEFAADKKKAK